MPDKFDRWNQGKIPPEQQPGKRREERREPNKLGPGCGNPMCPQCYPENNNMGGSPFGDNNEAARRRILEEVERLRQSAGNPFDSIIRDSSIRSAAFREFNTQETPLPERGPPQSYKDAREQVEKFILKADPTSFEDIVGNEEALATLIDSIQAPVKHANLYRAYGMKMPKGALLSGPPGCGKTMFARAAASEFIKLYGGEVEFISIQSTDIQSMFIGATEARIRNIFAFAREYKAYRGHPLLVFMDEAEIMFPDRTGRLRRVAPWEESQVATFLAEMDGIRESCVFLLLATNRPEALDSALLRDGRCDFKITVKRPTKEAAETILTNSFASTFIGTPDRATLVFAALEAMFDPSYVLSEAGGIIVDFAKKDIKQATGRHFLLEDIVSGAMLVSIPQRATRYAFARDKNTGIAKGVTVEDVIKAVNDIFEENKGLEHPYAAEEFMKKYTADVEKDLNNE